VQERGLAAYLAELIGTLLLVFFITSAIVLFHELCHAWYDQIGIFVPAGSDDIGRVENLLRSAGAVEVRHEAA